MTTYTRLAASCSVIALGMCGTASAQNAQTAPAAPTVAQADAVVVVTAQKRTENVQAVPMAVTVVTPAALASAGVTQLTDLSKVVPSLTLTPEANPVNNSVILRGVGTFAFSISAEPAVATVIDDVPAGFQAASFGDFVDLERVEVLRGPQSTLFGKSASAGLINIVTKAPSKTMTGEVDVTVTNDTEKRVAATVSGPISDMLRFRLTAAGSKWDGLLNNLATGEKMGGKKDRSVRGKLLLAPGNGFTAELGLNYAKIDADCCQGRIIKQDTANARLFGQPSLPASLVLNGVVPSPDNLDVRFDSPVYARSTLSAESLKLGYELPNGDSLLAVTAHSRFHLDDASDNDFTDAPAISAVTNGAVQGKYVQYGFFDAKVLSQEVRVTSSDEGRLRYVYGVFYQDDDLGRRLLRGPAISVVDYDAAATSTSKALFGQASFDVVSGSRLIAGLRRNKEDISYRFNKNTTKEVFGRSDSESVTTGRLGFQQDLAPDVMAFATYNRGYKGQAYDLTSALNPAIAAIQPVKSEGSNSFEVGFRSKLLDRRVTLNATAYSTKYTNFQAQEQQPGLSNAFVLSNVGSVETKGIEVDASARVTSQLRLNGGLAYTDAHVAAFNGAQCYPGQTVALGCIGGAQNLAGAVLPNSPKWKASAGLNYRISQTFTDHSLTLTSYYTYQSGVQFQLNQDPETKQGGVSIVNLGLAASDPQGRYDVSLFVNNLFDKRYNVRMDNQRNNWGGATDIIALPARDFNRYIGVRMSYHF
jgi:iron complex outermembrane receptor protein